MTRSFYLLGCYCQDDDEVGAPDAKQEKHEGQNSKGPDANERNMRDQNSKRG